MSFKLPGNKRIFAAAAAFCILLVLAAPFLAQFLINSRPFKSRLSKEIETYSGIELQPDTIEFILYPFPGIRFLDIDLKLNDHIGLRIDRAEVGLDIFKLPKGKIAARQIDIYGPRLNYTPAKAGQSEKAQIDPALGFKISFKELNHQITDQLSALFPDSRDTLEISIHQAKTDYFSTMDARLYLSRNKSGMSLKGQVKKIHIIRGQLPELDRLIGETAEQILADGLVFDLRLSPQEDLTARIKVNQPLVNLVQGSKTSLAAGDLALELSVKKDSVSARLIPAQITYPKANIGIEFNYLPGTGKTRLVFSGKEIDISHAREVCRPLLKGIRTGEILFDILRAGQAESVTVGFEADTLKTLFDDQNLTLDGATRLTQVKIPEVPVIVDNVSGFATLEKGVLHIEAQKGEVRGTKIQKGVLDIDLMNFPDEPFTGKFHLKADLNQLPATLMDLLPGTELAAQMALVSEVKGTADGILELNMKTGDNDLEVRVMADKIRASGKYSPIPLPLSITGGALGVDPDRVTINNLNSTIGTSPVTIDEAMVHLEPAPVLNIIKADALLSAEEFLPWIKSQPGIGFLSPVKKLAGRIGFEVIHIKGPMFNPSKWAYTLEGGAENIQIGFTDRDLAVQNLSCRFDLYPGKIQARNIRGTVNDLSWLKNTNSSVQDIKMPVYIVDGTVLDKTDKIFLNSKIKTVPGPEVFLNLSGKTLSDLSLSRISIKDSALTDALIIPKAAGNPRLSFQGQLNTLTLEKLLVKDSPLYRQLRSLTSGSQLIVSTDGASNVHIKTDQLNLDSLLSWFSDSSKDKNSTRKQAGFKEYALLAQKELYFTTDSLIYMNKPFTRVQARIMFDTGLTRIHINNANLCGLTAKGMVGLGHNTEAMGMTTEFEINSTSQNDISKVLGCLLNTETLIEGQYTFEGQLQGNDRPDLIARRQNGKLSFKAEKGRIYKATLLSRVLSVLNILGDTDIRQQGFGYKTLTLTADVKESVIHLEKAYIDADDMAIIASGWVDPLKDRLELTFLVAPFKTIDTIIQHIPLVNTLLSGRLVSFPAQASGKLSDPTVIPLHPSAVGKGLLTLFGDLIQAPVRLIKGEENVE